jgi:ubiquinone/menaquinone biosynthesis C-methylase UbiE
MAVPTRCPACEACEHLPVRRTPFERDRPADYLSRLAASKVGKGYKSVAMSEMAVGRGDTVVDLGCGPGTDLVVLADATGPTGAVIGIDSDPVAVEAAARAVEGRPWAQVRLADVHALDLADASADRVHTDRVLQHVADPGVVVAQARRVLRPGGRAVFAEPDYDTLVIDYPDARVMRAYRAFITEHVVRNASIGRQLARLAEQAGFVSSEVVPVTSVFRDVSEADRIFGFERVTRRAIASGFLHETAAADWLDHLATQPFFAAATLFVVVADA